MPRHPALDLAFSSRQLRSLPSQASGLLTSIMASAVSAAEHAGTTEFDVDHFVGNDYHPEAMAQGLLIARPPPSSPPKTADGRPILSSRQRSFRKHADAELVVAV